MNNERVRSFYQDFYWGDEWERIYVGNYEEYSITGQPIKKIHYISGGDGLSAVYILSNGVGTMYYVSNDYQGNIMLLTNENGSKAEEYSYDAWGRRRSPTNWNNYSVSAPSILYRGYTGHEHLDEFALINMNGRVYDPVLGRFLSPDNYVQAPDFTQSFNRYSYCWNNPLKFVDPSGEKLNFFQGLFFMFSGIIGVKNLIMAQENDWNFSQTLGHYAVDAAAFAVGGATFNGIGSGNMISALWTSGFTAGFISGGGHTWMNGGSAEDVIMNAVSGGFAGGWSGLGFAGLGEGLKAIGDINWIPSFGNINGPVSHKSLNDLILGIDLPSIELCNFTFQSFTSNPVTIVNKSDKNVMYLSEDGSTVGMVAPNSEHRGYIDAVSTKKYNDQIFKVPGHPDDNPPSYSTVVVKRDGSIKLRVYYNNQNTYFPGAWVARSAEKYGWLTKDKMIELKIWDYFSYFYNETYKYFTKP